MAVWLALVAWLLVGAWIQAHRTDRELTRLRTELDLESMLDGSGADALTHASSMSRDVTHRLDAPVLAPLRFVPVVGRQLRAASAQSKAVTAGLDVAATAGDDLRGLLPRLQAGPQRVAALHDAQEIAVTRRAELADIDLGTDEALIGPIADARTRIADAKAQALDALDRAAAMSEGMATFFQGPSDYLLLAANNAQMQNGQGMFLSAGRLHVQDGSLRLDAMEPTSGIPRPATRVELDPDLAARWGWLDPNDDFRHLGLSHRFPVTAPTAKALWEAAGRPPVDGVLMVDPFLLRALMSATGPIEVDGRQLTEDNIVTYALHDQYRGYLTQQGDTSFGTERRDRLQDVAIQAIKDFDAVDQLDPAAVQSLVLAARGRHLMAWGADPAVQAAWEAASVDGQISSGSMLLSVVNRSGNKLDWFIRSSADLHVEPGPDGLEAVVRIHVENHAPASGEPAYVVGPYPGSDLDAGEYLGLVTLDLPEAAQDARFDDVDPLAVAGGDGPNRTIAAWVRIERGGSTELVARFSLPDGTERIRVESSARARPTTWTAGLLSWEDRQPRSLAVPTGG